MIEHLHPNDDFLRKMHAFCPGCGNGIILHTFIKSLKSYIDEKESRSKSNKKSNYRSQLDNYIFLSGIGCSGWITSPHMNADTFHTTHGRSIPVATGVKVANPELNVVVISGDGDLASIGGNHLIHAARRNVDMICILVNNFNFGMTGGQCGPTTFHDAITTTTPYGNFEYPLKAAELVAAAGAAFSARWTVRHVVQLEKCMKNALSRSQNGFAFIEVLSTCTTQFEKRNYGTDDPKVLFDYFEKNSVNIKDRDKYSLEELDNKFVLGVFSDKKTLGLSKTIKNTIDCAKKSVKSKNNGVNK